MTHPFGLLRQSIKAELTSVKKLSKKNFHFPCFQYMLPRLSAYSTEGWLMNFHLSKLLSYENVHDCYHTSKLLFQQSYLDLTDQIC